MYVYAAVPVHTKISYKLLFLATGTALFIEFVTKWWVIVNNKQKLNKRLRDDRRAATTDVDDWQVKFLEEVKYFVNSLTTLN